jgi:hypothetical protein
LRAGGGQCKDLPRAACSRAIRVSALISHPPSLGRTITADSARSLVETIRQLRVMTLKHSCSLCCLSCTSGSVPSLLNDSMRNLLPAGTLSLPISQTELGSICNHSHSVDDWHPFPGEALLPYLTDHEDETLCRHLSFLVGHKFLSVQCKIGNSGRALVLRTYIIPFDLPGAQGKLRVRDEASVLKPARLCLRNVVPRILQDENLWNAHDSEPSSSSTRYFLNPDTVMTSFSL